MYRDDPVTESVLLFGKVPAAADFVRVNLRDAASLDLADWITRALETLSAGNGQLPAVVARFIYSSGQHDVAFVGAFAPSRDAVGRHFPVCIATPIPLRAAIDGYAAIPIAYADFLAAATELIHQVPVLTLEEVHAHLQSIRVPASANLVAAVSECRDALHQEPAADLCARLFDNDESALHYALHTFATAVTPLRGQVPARSSVVLDCPIAVDVDLLAWLSLAHEALRWRNGVASACWLAAMEPRLLLSLGAPTGQFFQLLAGEPSSKLWPLRTARADAREAATAQLSPMFNALGPADTVALDALIHTLADHSPS